MNKYYGCAFSIIRKYPDVKSKSLSKQTIYMLAGLCGLIYGNAVIVMLAAAEPVAAAESVAISVIVCVPTDSAVV